MDRKEIQETTIWALFEKGRSYHHRMNIYTDTDVNHRMYNGNQWAGAKLGEVEPVQINFIKPIVKYKCAVIASALFKQCPYGCLLNFLSVHSIHLDTSS